MEKQNSVLASAFTGTIYLFILQLFSRGITFVLNQILLRFTTAKVLGIVNIKLELMLETILFISREGIRMALLRNKSNIDNMDDEKKKKKEKKHIEINANAVTPRALIPIQKAINLSYIPIIVGCGLTVFVTYYFNKNQTQQNENSSSIFLYSIAALIELVSEPLYILSQYHMLFNIRVKAEGMAVFIRCITSFLLTLLVNYKGMEKSSNISVLCFAYAQLFYSITLLGMYGYSFYKKKNSIKEKQEDIDIESLHLKQGIKAFLPALIKEENDNGKIDFYYFDSHLLGLSMTLYIQSFIKYLLTQGDKIILNLLCSDVIQGVYAFVSNYGSLILRIVFQPIEETCRIYFSKELVSKESTA